jgi:DDE superfamily endonuclease
LRIRTRKLNRKWGKNHCLYGDKGYSISAEIQTPFKGRILSPAEQQFNIAMSPCRILVEYGFMRIFKQFAFCNYKHNQKLFWQRNAKASKVSAILANYHTCMYGFPLAKRIFGLDPPTVEDCLRV